MTQIEEKINKFNNLSFDEQAFRIWHHSTILLRKDIDELKVILFYFDGFYIKEFYDQKNYKILKFEAVTQNCLDEFLSEIELEKLF